MIAISTYTEPVPVNPVAVNDLPQVQQLEEEKEEKSEQTSFAELLAGLLRNSEKQEVPQEVFEAEISGNEISGDLIHAAEFLEEFSSADKKVPAEFFTEDSTVLLGAQKLFTDLEAGAEEAAASDFSQEISNLIRTDLLPEADLDTDFFDVFPDKNVHNIDIQQTAAASGNVQEVLAETKKERVQKSTDNIEKDINIDTIAKKDDHSNAEVVRANPENEKISKLDEMRASRSRRDGFSINVQDMRSGSAEALNSQTRFAAIETSVGRVGGDAGVREITLELRLPEQNTALNQANTSWEAKSGSALENLLARELHQNLNGDIVRHASVALKDGGEGTIKLSLKPESLGNVKIALELSDNKITGKIFVESEEALNAFRKEISSLEQAFKDSGFSAADLNLSLSSGEQNAEGWEENQRVPPIFASRYDENSEQGTMNIVNVFIGQRKGSINMLA